MPILSNKIKAKTHYIKEKYMSDITLSKEKFLRASKKLSSVLKTEHNINSKLSQSQEILSSILGFKNFHALEELFKKSVSARPPESINKMDITNFLQTQSSTNLSNLVCTFVNHGDAAQPSAMWKTRACQLLVCVFQILCYIRDNQEKSHELGLPTFVLDIASIYEYLKLDSLIKVSKTRKDLPESIKQNLKNYLLSLPGFQENAPKQNDTALEQHGYLHMQLIPAIKLLEVLINNSALLIVPKEKVVDIYLSRYAPDIRWEKGFYWPQEAVSDFFNLSIISLIYHHLPEIKKNYDESLSQKEFFDLFNSYSLIDLFNLINYTLNADLKNGALKVLINLLEHIDVVKVYSTDLASHSNDGSKSLYYQAYIKSYQEEEEVKSSIKGNRKVN